ncbi:MAG: hypothetical protein KAS32_10605 [Candidatus Peribacteraceae bacterium]|nr:hypothetical protein [Candidatus Peribacteraceae bacterium]
MNINGKDYVVGQDRNDDTLVAHLYEGQFGDPGDPMCVRGWNRSDGKCYSIFRNVCTGGLCKICLRRASAGKPSVPSRKRKTKWI